MALVQNTPLANQCGFQKWRNAGSEHRSGVAQACGSSGTSFCRAHRFGSSTRIEGILDDALQYKIAARLGQLSYLLLSQ